VACAHSPSCYVNGADDPAFDAYQPQGASNIVIVELVLANGPESPHHQHGARPVPTSATSALTNWIYFVVRTLQRNECFVASDARLSLEAAGARGARRARQRGGQRANTSGTPGFAINATS
jgi:hypothetical protein